jgi:hypothetical protein
MTRFRPPEPRDFEIARRYREGNLTLAQVGAEFGLTGNQVWWRVWRVERQNLSVYKDKTPRKSTRVVGNVVYGAFGGTP